MKNQTAQRKHKNSMQVKLYNYQQSKCCEVTLKTKKMLQAHIIELSIRTSTFNINLTSDNSLLETYIFIVCNINIVKEFLH